MKTLGPQTHGGRVTQLLQLAIVATMLAWIVPAAFRQLLVATHDVLVSATILLLLAATALSGLLPRSGSGRS